jgi:hypothetical protein
MGNELTFDILPFDPMVIPNPQIALPIDFDDFAQQLRDKWPAGEVSIHTAEGETCIRLYITTRYGPWNVAGFIEGYSQFYVEGWPKRIAKELIFWYRQYIPTNYPLFLVIPESGYIAELTAQTSLDDIERMYPFPVPED